MKSLLLCLAISGTVVVSLAVIIWWVEFWFGLNTNKKWPLYICFPMAVGMPVGLLVAIAVIVFGAKP